MLSAGICFTSCKKNSAETGPGSSPPVNSNVSTNLDNSAMLQLVNDTRAAGCTCGTTVMPPASALTWSDVLAAAALSHSQDMSATGQFSHNSSDGTSFSARITAAGYIGWSALGENIAFGQTSEQQVFDAWIQSEGHCKNIMDASFKEMGAAKVGTYWTQDFGAKQ